MKQIAMTAGALLLATAAQAAGTAETTGNPMIDIPEFHSASGLFDIDALEALGRVSDPQVSPDGKRVLFGISYENLEQNRSNNDLYVMNIDGSGLTRITATEQSESGAVWMTGGSKIAFMSADADGKMQLWIMNADGTDRRQISDVAKGIGGFLFSPDEKQVVLISNVKYTQNAADIYPDLPKATGRVVDDLMYKHWDEWVTTAPHPFIADFDGNAISNTKDILEGLPYESPMKPFGGIEQLAWSPASDKVAFTCRMKTGLAYAISTDSDIYEYDLLRGGFINLCKRDVKTQTEAAAQNGDGVQPNSIDEFMGYDTNPQYSPDGKYIAWQSMERDGYEADLNRLCVMNRTTGEKRFVVDARNFPSNVDAFLWNKDSQGIYFLGVWHGETHIYHADITKEEPTVRPLTQGMYDYASIALCGNSLIAKRHSMSAADEIFAVQADSEQPAPARQLTTENQHIYDQLEMGKVEPRWMETTDGKQMLTWVIYPPQFDPNKKYPTLLFCEGGPQSPVSQFWSYRWNFQIMAANGYIIVAPNRRGLPGFGVEWNEAISGDYGGQCMKDYFTAIDAMAKEPFVDADRLGCVGASFGGFSVYWLAGHHDKRFKAFIAHDGIFNMEMQYLETEEKWFANWDMGGAYWEKDNATAQRTFANSPHKFVDKWDTPILCIHGEKDYRILPNQAMAAFDAAVMRGVPAQLLIYPDENHWVLKPQNGVLWQRTFFEWLDRWLKK